MSDDKKLNEAILNVDNALSEYEKAGEIVNNAELLLDSSEFMVNEIQKLRAENEELIKRKRKYKHALDWISRVNAMDYEYKAVVQDALKGGDDE